MLLTRINATSARLQVKEWYCAQTETLLSERSKMHHAPFLLPDFSRTRQGLHHKTHAGVHA